MDMVDLSQHRLTPDEALRRQRLDREEDKSPRGVPLCREQPGHQFRDS